MRVVGVVRHFLHLVFAQDLASTTASAGSAVADRKRDTESARQYAGAGEACNSPVVSLAAALHAKRAAAATATT